MRTLVIAPLFAGMLFAQNETRTETRTTTWNGTLVDAACQTTETQRTTRDAAKTETTTTETVQCPVTAQTTSFGLITADGRFIRFDSPSNTRVIEVVKTSKVSSNQPMRVHVVGIATGDTAVVESLNFMGQAQTQTVGEADRIASPPAELTFDVRHDGDQGKLIVGEKSIRFENVSDSKESKIWTYAQIEEFERESDNHVSIDPYDGDEWEFQLDGPKLADSVYKLISDRIVAARGR